MDFGSRFDSQSAILLLNEIDKQLAQFVSKASELESKIYEELTDHDQRTLASPFVTYETPRTRPVSVHDLLVSSERLALMSHAPVHIKENISLETVRPPVITETQMSQSLLFHQPKELLELARTNARPSEVNEEQKFLQSIQPPKLEEMIDDFS